MKTFVTHVTYWSWQTRTSLTEVQKIHAYKCLVIIQILLFCRAQDVARTKRLKGVTLSVNSTKRRMKINMLVARNMLSRIRAVRIPLVAQIFIIVYGVLAVYFVISYQSMKSNTKLSKPYKIHVAPMLDRPFISHPQSNKTHHTTKDKLSQQYIMTKRYRKWSNAGFISRTFHLPVVIIRKMVYGRTFASLVLGFSFGMCPYYFPLSFVFPE